MTQPVKFGLNVDPNTGGLPIAERITAIAGDRERQSCLFAEQVVPAARESLARHAPQP